MLDQQNYNLSSISPDSGATQAIVIAVANNDSSTTIYGNKDICGCDGECGCDGDCGCDGECGCDGV